MGGSFVGGGGGGGGTVPGEKEEKRAKAKRWQIMHANTKEVNLSSALLMPPAEGRRGENLKGEERVGGRRAGEGAREVLQGVTYIADINYR